MSKQKFNLIRLRAILSELSEEASQNKSLIYSGDPAVDKLIYSNPFAFLLGVISDQMIKSEQAWTLPFLIKKRLGHLNPRHLLLMNEAQLEGVIRNPYSLHRFPRKMAHFFITASAIITQQYKGNAENIWSSVESAREIQKRLYEFPGISQKKASMMTKMLIRDWDVTVNDLYAVDLPFDVHIRRILLRIGLIKNDSFENVQTAGRKLNSNYPAAFDDAIWLIGRRFCHSRKPDHNNCPLSKVCPKLHKNITS